MLNNTERNKIKILFKEMKEYILPLKKYIKSM